MLIVNVNLRFRRTQCNLPKQKKNDFKPMKSIGIGNRLEK